MALHYIMQCIIIMYDRHKIEEATALHSNVPACRKIQVQDPMLPNLPLRCSIGVRSCPQCQLLSNAMCGGAHSHSRAGLSG
jgi:hypothetical protein